MASWPSFCLAAAKILREGVRVYVTDPERAREFERDILLRAADLIPFLRRGRLMIAQMVIDV